MKNRIVEEWEIRFVQHAENYWLKISEGDTKGANDEEKANRKIVNKLCGKNNITVSLLPLLENESSAVRLAAAGYLIKSEGKAEAVLVLQKLLKEDKSLISHSAGAILRLNNVS